MNQATLYLVIDPRRARRIARRLRSLFKHLAQLSLQIAHRFFDRVDLLLELTCFDLHRLAARPAAQTRVALRLTNRYFDALAAVRARDLNFFVIQAEWPIHEVSFT